VPRERHWSAANLRNGIEDWRQITPQSLQEAVGVLRKNFATQAWKVSQIMTTGCHPALRKGLSAQARETSRLMERIGFPALPTVDQGQTEPAVFSAYFYRCADLLANDLRRIFSKLLDISSVQSTLLNLPPIEWAATQGKVLVADESYGISSWLKFTCDKEYEAVGDDIKWKSWRAPRWLFMQPFANWPYDSAETWERMNEADTEHVLGVVEDKFNFRLVTKLGEAVDEAHINLAMKPPVKATQATPPQGSDKDSKVTRKAFITPILEKKGFSVHDWATKAHVDFHTANNYLKGKTKPFPATLKKLADALGVEIARLPD
jgi:hypothetical protein